MEIRTKLNNVNSYGKDFSSNSQQLEHQQAMAHEDHDFNLKMQEAQHQHELKLKEKELGWIGHIFGSSDNASKNIAATICFVLLLAVILISGCVYWKDKNTDFISTVWQTILPVVTLALGYIFGKKD